MTDFELQVAKWAASTPLELLEDELRELERRRMELEVRIDVLRRHVSLLGAARDLASGLTVHGPALSKRDAVLRVLSDAPSEGMRLAEIRRALVQRGWLTGDRRATHALEVAVATMAQRGELRRIRRGLYELPRPLSDQVAA
ncbi:MAG TPA: hypothetical protein VMT74_06360 [Gaiellaceae bacterium]|nr:hypothetical protein [Gaiellaceae bacterium]